jgi:hypothetical protein
MQKLKIHTSHLICGGSHLEINNIFKLQDQFLIKKFRGISIDIKKFKSELVEFEYDERKKN